MSRYLVALLSLFALGLAACVPEDPCRCVEQDAGGLPELDAFTLADASGGDARYGTDATRDAALDAELEITPAALDFGFPCYRAASDLTVRNIGAAHTGPLEVEVTGSGFMLVGTDCVPGLAPATTCVVEVLADSEGLPLERDGTLRVHGGGAEASAALHIRSGYCDPILWAIPGSIDFGAVVLGERSETRLATFRSDVIDPRPLQVAIEGSNPGDFEIVPAPDSCAGLLPYPGQSCEVLVRFAPTAAGARSAELRVEESGGPRSAAVALSGTGE